MIGKDYFGVMMSNVHMAWTRTVCGRIESNYRYSKDVVYNNLPWPTPTDAQKAKIEQTAQAGKGWCLKITLYNICPRIFFTGAATKANTAKRIALKCLSVQIRYIMFVSGFRSRNFPSQSVFSSAVVIAVSSNGKSAWYIITILVCTNNWFLQISNATYSDIYQCYMLKKIFYSL